MQFEIAISLVFGFIAGTAYFAGLWLTVRQVTNAGLSPLWLLASAAVRLAALVAALFWIMDGRWERLLAALAGILAARLIATRLARKTGTAEATPVEPPQMIGAADADHTR